MKRQKWLLLGLIWLVACTTAVPREQGVVETPFDEITSLAAPTAKAPATGSEIDQEARINPRVTIDEEYSISTLIPFDGIRPIYEPVFVSAQEAPYKDDELVMGIAWEGQAKAYSVTVLRFREMVNDELAGIPTLVTW
jgi:hypothetical protein